MRIRKLIRLAVVSAACVLPVACATSSYSRTGVAALPAGVKGKAGANASIEIEGLKLRVETLDRATQQQAIPPLALRLVFDPHELGYTFDPAQVVLRAADGTTWSPRVYGPGQFATGPWTCVGAGEAGGSASPYHALAPKTCFELAFDVALEPDARLELALSGLARGSKRLEPVSLTLARRRGRSIDRLYWLEILGYAAYV
jgi:hypothetical protein